MKPEDLSPALRDDADEPAFSAPWEAHAFALAVKLHEQGKFSWTEWSEFLGKEIAVGEPVSVSENSNDYYRLWYQALEQLLLEKGMIKREELTARQQALKSETAHPEH